MERLRAAGVPNYFGQQRFGSRGDSHRYGEAILHKDHAAFVREFDLQQFPYISSEILGRSYGVSKLPYAVLIDENGRIASMGIINSREHLESLFESRELGVGSIQEYFRKQPGGSTSAGSGAEP